MLVSVVIPTRDRLEYLKQAIASATAQGHPELEVVVVDDASSDGTAAFLESLPPPVRSFRLARHGERSAARNRGLYEAKGDYVWFLDDDDLLEPGAVPALAAYAERFPQAVAVVGQMRHFDDSTGTGRTEDWVRKPILADVWLDSLAVTVLGAGRCLLRRRDVVEVGGFPAQYPPFEDHYFSLVLARRGPVALVPDVVTAHRLHPGQSDLAANQHLERTIRADVLATYDQPDRLVAERRLAAFERVRAADTAFELMQPWRAFRLYVKALRRDPSLVRSPVLGGTIRSRMVKCLAGRPGLAAARRWRAAARERQQA